MNPVYAHKLKRAQVRRARAKDAALQCLVSLGVVALSLAVLFAWLSLDGIAAAIAGGAR